MPLDRQGEGYAKRAVAREGADFEGLSRPCQLDQKGHELTLFR